MAKYILTCDEKAEELLERYAEEEKCTKADIIRKSLNFYKLKRMAEEMGAEIALLVKEKPGRYKVIKIVIGKL